MHKQNTNSIGFTVVELLIVIVVIAILAAISVVAFRGIQDRANDATVEANIASAIRKMELAKVDLGRYPRTESEFHAFKFSKSAYDTTQHNVFYCLDRVNDRYALGLRSKSLNGYIVSNGTVSRGVTVNSATTCEAIGRTWVNDANTYVLHGYYQSSSSWNSLWGWTN